MAARVRASCEVVCLGGQRGKVRVVPAVVPDGAVPGHGSGEAGVGAGEPSRHEEGRRDPSSAEDVEDRRHALSARAAVERQRHDPSARGDPGHDRSSQGAGEQGPDRGPRRRWRRGRRWPTRRAGRRGRRRWRGAGRRGRPRGPRRRGGRSGGPAGRGRRAPGRRGAGVGGRGRRRTTRQDGGDASRSGCRHRQEAVVARAQVSTAYLRVPAVRGPGVRGEGHPAGEVGAYRGVLCGELLPEVSSVPAPDGTAPAPASDMILPMTEGAERPDGYPATWEADVVLRDGSVAHLRPITPADADAVRRFHAGQSDESIYMRFFAPLRQLSDRDVRRFTHVDYRTGWPWSPRCVRTSSASDGTTGSPRRAPRSPSTSRTPSRARGSARSCSSTSRSSRGSRESRSSPPRSCRRTAR